MELSQRVDELEAELKIVKNEVQAVLLDIRERILSYYDNPFQIIEAKSGGSKGDVDASIIGGGGSDGGKTDASPAAPQAQAPSQAPLEPTRPAAAVEAESGQMKALMDQMERERKALEQEKELLNQERQLAQTVSAQQSLGAQPGMGIPGQGMPMQGMAQPMQQTPMMMQPPMQAPMGQMPMGQMPIQPGMGPIMAQPMQGGLPTQGGMPVQHQHTHNRGGAESPEGDGYSERRGYPDYQETGNYREGGTNRRSSGAQGSRKPGRELEERGSTGSRRSDKFDRRKSSGARWSEKDREKQEETSPEEESTAQETSQVNLMVLVGLVRWVEKSIRKIGKDRVEAIIEIYRTAGYLPAGYNDTIPQVIRLAEDEKPEEPVSMGDSINVLLQLDNLLGGKFKAESAVLATLFGEEGGYPWTKP